MNPENEIQFCTSERCLYMAMRASGVAKLRSAYNHLNQGSEIEPIDADEKFNYL
jgi:hypothetical protein